MALPAIIAIAIGKGFQAMDLLPAHSNESWKSSIVAFCQGITVSYITHTVSSNVSTNHGSG